MEKIFVEDLGKKKYHEAWQYQEQLLQQNIAIKSKAREYNIAQPLTKHHFLFVEHFPVVTIGKSGNMGNLLMSESFLNARGIELVHTNRGGDITFHGPGQIVGYPIFDLEKFDTDIGKYLRNVEEVIILTLSDYGIAAGRSKGETGVWIDAGIPGQERKICAIGVRCSRWITMHGFALNINTGLDNFQLIVPCGIQGKQVTSLQKETGNTMDLDDVKQKILKHTATVFAAEIIG